MTADLLELATEAAAKAAQFLVDGWASRVVVDTKSSGTDVVTQMDRRSEAMLVKTILAARPDDAIIDWSVSGSVGSGIFKDAGVPLDMSKGSMGWASMAT